MLCITESYLQQESYFQLNVASFKEAFQNANVNGELIYHTNNRLVIPPLPPLIRKTKQQEDTEDDGERQGSEGFQKLLRLQAFAEVYKLHLYLNSKDISTESF